MNTRMIRLAVAAAMAIGFAGRGEAGIVTFEFTGGSGASAFSGTFWWDQDTPDLYPANPNTGAFQPTPTALWGFSVVSASHSYSAVANAGLITMTHYGSIEINMESADGGEFYFNYLDGQDWGSDGPNILPASLDLSRSTHTPNVTVRVTNLGIYESGDVTSLSAASAAVPEPASLAMAMIGGVGLLAFARRRSD